MIVAVTSASFPQYINPQYIQNRREGRRCRRYAPTAVRRVAGRVLRMCRISMTMPSPSASTWSRSAASTSVLQRHRERFRPRVFTPAELARLPRPAPPARRPLRRQRGDDEGAGDRHPRRRLAGDRMSCPNRRGKPLLFLYGRARERARDLGLTAPRGEPHPLARATRWPRSSASRRSRRRTRRASPLLESRLLTGGLARLSREGTSP